MLCTPSSGEPGSRARCFRLSRRHLLGVGAALFATSIFPIAAHAAPEGYFVDSPDSSSADGYPVDALAIDWPPTPPPSSMVDVPYRTQLDGSPQARSNCGPASLAMMIGQFDNRVAIADLRRSVNQFMGSYWVNNGSTWEALASAAKVRGYQVSGLFATGPGKYRRWSADDLTTQIKQGNAVMILVRYRALPGRQSSTFYGNHYVVIVGVDPDGTFIFDDPAFPDAATGAELRMSRQQLNGAWSSVTSGIDYTGMVITPKRR